MVKVTEEFCPDYEHAALMIGMVLFLFAAGGDAELEEIQNALDAPPWELVNRSLAWVLEILPDDTELPM